MPLHQYTATQMVKTLQSGEFTAAEITQHQRDRIQSLNPEIKAIVAMNDGAGTGAGGALAGLPITVKDQIHCHGMACTFGSERHKDFRPTQTAPVVERLLQAGAHVIAKTNLPPFAMDFQCSNALFGTTNNPWNLDYTTGGSSGGGAAAVAAGLSFLDIGTDLSGSLRIPASFCGVFSLLPSEEALPNEGMMADGASPLKHFARMGPIARNPDDLALAWRHMQPSPEAVQSAFAMPQIYWSTDGGINTCDSIVRCFGMATAAWKTAGFQVATAHPVNFGFRQARRAFGEIMGYETGALMPALVRLLARITSRASARRSPEFLANVMRGYRHNRKNYDAALSEKATLSDALDSFLGDNGVWVLPVTATSVFKHMVPTSDRNGVRDYAEPLFINGQAENYFDALTAFVTPISLTGHPVVTMPLGLDNNGLPIGAQLIGRKGSEVHLIQTAKRLHGVLNVPDCPMLKRD
ncbi:amidase [Yoonia sp. GPGPB17]|uniref:amidase n=1 Tax=Yoonia sp. GPGPB17 TaxID=3026147 RepID=UPI0030BEA0B3